MIKGKIIFLNGVSSTGKSTLSKGLQKLMDEPYHWLNVDNFMAFTDMTKHPGHYFEKGKDPVSLFPHVVKLYADLGVNVIVDVAFVRWKGPRLFLAEETFEKCVELLHDYPLVYVLVTCPYKELKRRHDLRGDRGKRSLEFDYADQELIGDLTVDHDLIINTHNEGVEESLLRIQSSFNLEEKAFKRLWKVYKRGI